MTSMHLWQFTMLLQCCAFTKTLCGLMAHNISYIRFKGVRVVIKESDFECLIKCHWVIMAETVMGMSVFCTGVCEDKELTELMWDVNTDLNFWPWLKRFCQVEDTWEAPCMHHECVSCTFWMHTCMLSCLDSWHMAWGLWKELSPPPSFTAKWSREAATAASNRQPHL